jgi:FdhE protein
MFAARSERFRVLAAGHDLEAYLRFLGALSDLQVQVLEGLPEPAMPPADALERAHEHAMPPLDRNSFAIDAAFETAWETFLSSAAALEMPEQAREALGRLQAADAALRDDCIRNVLADSIPIEALAEHVFVAAILQVHFARLAQRLDPAALKPVGDGACPSCGAPPVASAIVGWPGAHGARFCSCSLCGTLWNYVRACCTVCGSTAKISYREVEGGTGHIKAEVCESCGSYAKVVYQHKDPALNPVADDVASLGLDLLVKELGFRRGSVNAFLLGY